MDALSDVLRASRLTGGVFLHAEFSAPWCMVGQLAPELCTPFMGPAPHLVCYHYVVEGRMRVRTDDNAPIDLVAGDLVLLPRNDRHLLGSDLTVRPVEGAGIICPPNDGGLFTIRHGGGGETTRLICGFLGCEEAAKNPVIAALPSAFRLSVEDAGAAEWIRSTFQFAAGEVETGQPGSATVLAKLSELLFVEAVRRYLDTLPAEQTG
ncbi:MAG TPA: cupin domain-containing protein, partial [Parvularculaceae bacterium]|nr:cupin domain-containing protein [Parvularculaceae bacterium]